MMKIAGVLLALMLAGCGGGGAGGPLPATGTVSTASQQQAQVALLVADGAAQACEALLRKLDERPPAD